MAQALRSSLVADVGEQESTSAESISFGQLTEHRRRKAADAHPLYCDCHGLAAGSHRTMTLQRFARSWKVRVWR